MSKAKTEVEIYRCNVFGNEFKESDLPCYGDEKDNFDGSEEDCEDCLYPRKPVQSQDVNEARQADFESLAADLFLDIWISDIQPGLIPFPNQGKVKEKAKDKKGTEDLPRDFDDILINGLCAGAEKYFPGLFGDNLEKSKSVATALVRSISSGVLPGREYIMPLASLNEAIRKNKTYQILYNDLLAIRKMPLLRSLFYYLLLRDHYRQAAKRKKSRGKMQRSVDEIIKHLKDMIGNPLDYYERKKDGSFGPYVDIRELNKIQNTLSNLSMKLKSNHRKFCTGPTKDPMLDTTCRDIAELIKKNKNQRLNIYEITATLLNSIDPALKLTEDSVKKRCQRKKRSTAS